MSVGIEIAFSLEDGRMMKVKSTSQSDNITKKLLDTLYRDAQARTLAVLAIPPVKEDL